MADYREAFVGIDVAKLKNSIAVAESGRDGEIRYFGEVDVGAGVSPWTLQWSFSQMAGGGAAIGNGLMM